MKDLEEQQRIKTEENEKKKVENEMKAKLQKMFLKEQKTKIKKDFTNKITDRNELVNSQKQFEDKTHERMVKIKSNMVDYIKSTKDERKKAEEHEKEQTLNFYNLEETQQLFERYEKGIKQFYKYYASQDKQQIEFNLELKNDTINQTEFTKFGY